jgi:hypothetical protein
MDQRADLLQELLDRHLPNLLEVDIDHFDDTYEVLKGLASHRRLRSLSLTAIPGRRRSNVESVCELPVSNFPNLISLKLTQGNEDMDLVPSNVLEILASMRQLKKLHLACCRSWAIPFASGGLSDLTLDHCKNVHLADLEAILAVDSDTLKCLTLDDVPKARNWELAGGQKYKLNQLESLSVANINEEAYFRRFLSSPIKTPEVGTNPPPSRSAKPG